MSVCMTMLQKAAVGAVMLATLLAGCVQAQTVTVLFSFQGGLEGSGPNGAVTVDAQGNVYGTTLYGGFYGYGTVFKLSPNADGTYSETVLYSFAGGTDGASPTSGVVIDANGNLFGATPFGGSTACSCGTVFELSPQSNGKWQEKVIYRFPFSTSTNAANPLLLDASGNLYSTYWGNATSYGYAFRLSPNGSGAWRAQMIHVFGAGHDGQYPSPLIADPKGNFYGVADGGGAYNNGAVFELMPRSNGSWAETLLYSFNCKDVWASCYSSAQLARDAAGNLYGETGTTAFELSPRSGGGWGLKTLYPLTASTLGYAEIGLTLDSAGNLYGASYDGGQYAEGTLFELKPTTGGLWLGTDLFDFNEGVSIISGSGPLLLTAQGTLLGFTGGCQPAGCLFQLTP
jgi:uncharacterized repeat protein (TIGR03803 family)